MTRKELGIAYGLGKGKIRELLRQAGVNHQKELLYNDVIRFLRVAGRPVVPSDFDRIFDRFFDASKQAVPLPYQHQPHNPGQIHL